MIDYDSFSRCHLTDIFFAFHAGAKELIVCGYFVLSPSIMSEVNILHDFSVTFLQRTSQVIFWQATAT